MADLVTIFSASLNETVEQLMSSGRVEDASGAVISGASLTATSLDTNQKQTATSDYDGRYRFPYLQVGSYKLSIEAPGLAPLTKQLTVTVGQALNLPLESRCFTAPASIYVKVSMPRLGVHRKPGNIIIGILRAEMIEQQKWSK